MLENWEPRVWRDGSQFWWVVRWWWWSHTYQRKYSTRPYLVYRMSLATATTEYLKYVNNILEWSNRHLFGTMRNVLNEKCKITIILYFILGCAWLLVSRSGFPVACSLGAAGTSGLVARCQSPASLGLTGHLTLHYIETYYLSTSTIILFISG